MIQRCGWCPDNLPIYIEYHDLEWGVPVHDDIQLFEMLTLEGAQAGLNWLTVLRKRAHYREAFDNFQPEIVAAYPQSKVELLLQDAGIIRNRLKITSTITNAQAVLRIQEEFGSLNTFLWSYAGGKSIQNSWKSMSEIPVKTPESDAMSKGLVKRGFRFVGSTICYAFMQAVGIVNDHEINCFRHRELQEGRG